MRFILRLDDACPQMNIRKWNRIEKMLDRYGVKPIVGIIPDNQDRDFQYEKVHKFWEKCKVWEQKGWTIAIHGFQHKLFKHEAKGYYQRSHSTNTEWAGVGLERQREMLKKGQRILKSHDITPTCFFAPCHTYDINTVKVVADAGLFISDGYALRPYIKDGARFLPSLFDKPINCKLEGVYTFVYHPNNMCDRDFEYLERYLKVHAIKFVTADSVMKETVAKGQGIIGRLLEIGIYVARGLRDKLKRVK